MNDADSQKQLADAKADREATKKQLEEDEQFFAETKEACKAKAMAWAERSRLRTEELAGMKQAVEILTSDEASSTFEASHDTFFLQTSAVVQDSASSAAALFTRARAKLVYSLKAIAKKTHSLRIASLAAMA